MTKEQLEAGRVIQNKLISLNESKRLIKNQGIRIMPINTSWYLDLIMSKEAFNQIREIIIYDLEIQIQILEKELGSI
ncbi:hypothetical protein M0R04_09340 [Candidatus Dojkabacteria bacterium]|jgi:hypothetical protein|nr:hypothetical protein [Candidatus Dojkabacteria bacterium]